MNINTYSIIGITEKGLLELKEKKFKLDFRQRNILFLIEKNCKTINNILEKIAFTAVDVVNMINNLHDNGFIYFVLSTREGFRYSDWNHIYLNYNVIINDAKFPLVNFCTKHFISDYYPIIQGIEKSSNIDLLQLQVQLMYNIVLHDAPNLFSELTNLIKYINKTCT